MFTLSIVVWMTATPAGGLHTVTSTPMPMEVCMSMADKINMPRIFPHVASGKATCQPVVASK